MLRVSFSFSMIKSAAACKHVVRVSGTVGATYSSVITPTQGRESIAGIIYYTIFFSTKFVGPATAGPAGPPAMPMDLLCVYMWLRKLFI